MFNFRHAKDRDNLWLKLWFSISLLLDLWVGVFMSFWHLSVI